MKKRIILGIGLLLILLPLITPSNLTSTNARENDSYQNSPEFQGVTAGTKLYYDVSTFQYGDGIWDVLDMLLSQVGGPSFDKGLIGTLEGSELQVYISAMEMLDIYNNYNFTSGLYEEHEIVNAIQTFAFLKLNSDLGAYVNASQFSFPDDFSQKDWLSFYDKWPFSHFVDNITDEPSSVFWNSFNMSFEPEFERGFQDANFSFMYGGDWYSNNFWEMPQADWYGDYDISWFGDEVGQYIGYDIGYSSYWESGGDITWNAMSLALNGFYAGFFMARDDGYNAGQLDFTTNKIPDKRPPPPPAVYADVEEFAEWYFYPHFYQEYYQGGFLYEGSLIFFNGRLYDDLYNAEWETYWSGYVNGYQDEYWRGQDDGYWDDYWGAGYKTNYYPPSWYEPWNDRDAGYMDGRIDGYDRGYDDGYFGLTVGEERMNAYWHWQYDSYFDGFANASADVLASSPYNIVPASLPVAVPVTEYDFAANEIYLNQYGAGYDRGFKYATLVTSPDSLNWLWSNGPFYTMTLPDAEFYINTGSIVPTPLMSYTMFTEINMSLMDYKFDWGTHDYWPFSDNFISFMTFDASGTDFTELDTFDQPRNDTDGSPGFSTTWDLASDYFEFEMDANISEPGVLMDFIWGYNTSTGMLLNVSASIDFYSIADMWLDVVLELNEGKTETFSPTMPVPLQWSYFLSNFIFYYDLPPATPSEFVEGVSEYKANALASVGNNFLTVEMAGIEGLWARATMTLQDPSNLANPPSVGSYAWPLFSGGGPLWLTDWNFFEGVHTTAVSILGNVDYFVAALTALAGQNTNVDLSTITFIPTFGEYYYAATSIQYYYLTLQADLDFGWDMLNGDWEWESTAATGWVNATFYVGIDYATGVVLGAGARASFDFIMSQNPNYGMDGAGMSAYLEVLIKSTHPKNMMDLFDLIGGQFPQVPEFGLISILSIIGLAGIVSAVIFHKRK